MTEIKDRRYFGKSLKWWREFLLGYLLMLPLFILGIYLSISWGLGLGIGFFVGAGFACAPLFIVVLLVQRRK